MSMSYEELCRRVAAIDRYAMRCFEHMAIDFAYATSDESDDVTKSGALLSESYKASRPP